MGGILGDVKEICLNIASKFRIYKCNSFCYHTTISSDIVPGTVGGESEGGGQKWHVC